MSRMNAVTRVARVSSLVILAVAFAACRDGTTTAPAPAVSDISPQVGALAAHAIAAAMAETQIRTRVLIDMRNSPYSEHKLVLQDYLRSGGGRELLAAMGRAGIDADGLAATLDRTPPIQFYVPIASQRASWRGTPDVLVVPNLTRAVADTGFMPGGAAERIRPSQSLPSGVSAIFVLQGLEPTFRRWAGATAATETIELAGESQIGSGRVERDAAGHITAVIDDTPEGSTKPLPSAESMDSAGTWVDWIGNYGVCDGIFCDDLELQFFSTSPGGDYAPNVLTGIPGGSGSWSGWFKIHSLHATGSNPIEVWLWETDNTSGDDEFYCADGETPCSPYHNPILTGTDGVYFAECTFLPCDKTTQEHIIIRFRDRADPVVTTVTVAPTAATMYVGGTAALTATAKDQYGDVMSGKTATWTSLNPSVVTVLSTGALTANASGVAGGQATVRATIDGVNGTSAITVYVPLTVGISGPTQIRPGATCLWDATVSGGTSPYTYNWFNDNMSVGTGSEYTGGKDPGNLGDHFTLRVDVADAGFGRGSHTITVYENASAQICRF